VCELLAQSLIAWRLPGRVEITENGILVSDSARQISVASAPPDVPFRWMVIIDGRSRGAISLVAVLRQVRSALDPDYTLNRVRIAVSPLVPA
jgi:hypothetical protein